MKNIKIPNKFRYNGHTVSVRIVSPEVWQHGEDNVGCLDPCNMTIDLRADHCPSVLRQKFLHEVVHLMLLPINPQIAEDEQFVEQLSQAMNQLGMRVEEVKP